MFAGSKFVQIHFFSQWFIQQIKPFLWEKKNGHFSRKKFIDSPVCNLNVITSNLRPRSIFVPFVE